MIPWEPFKNILTLGMRYVQEMLVLIQLSGVAEMQLILEEKSIYRNLTQILCFRQWVVVGLLFELVD